MTRRRTRRAAAPAALAVLLAGCGASDPHTVLTQAGENLAQVRSGTMDLKMTVSGGDGSANGQIGFQERGPFSLPAAGALPVAHTDVVHFVGARQESSTFISTGKNVYISSGGHTFALPPAQVQQLRQASAAPAGGTGLGTLRFDHWAKEASLAEGPRVDGVSTDRVSGAVDVRQFLNDLMQLSRSLGETASVPQVNDADAQNLATIVRSSHFELLSGRDDHLVRRLTVAIDFAAPAAGTSAALARYSKTRLEVDLSLGGVNQPVTVGEPAGAEPFTAFCAQSPDAPACKPAQS